MERTCNRCGNKLSDHNPGTLCFVCQEKNREARVNSARRFYDVADMMEILGLESEEQVRRKGRAGLIPGKLPGIKAHRYSKEVIDQWIRSGGRVKAEARNSVHPKMFLEDPRVTTYAEGPGLGLARYATLMVRAEGSKALDCWAKAKVREKGKTFPLHWAGTEYTPAEYEALKVDIDPDMPGRLDVAFAVGPPSAAVPQGALLSGNVVMIVGTWEERVATAIGCFLAQPLALYSPHRSLDAYLPPGTYHIEVVVGSDNADGATAELELTSPISWDGLTLKRLTSL